MNAIEIILILLGIIIIIISCRLVGDTKGTTNPDRSLDAKAIEHKKYELEELFSGVSEEIIERTEEELSRLSNEKIIAVSEYSDQILEKINHNHEEVVFLYHMLSEKESAFKQLFNEKDPVITKPIENSETINASKLEDETQNGTQQRNMQAKFGTLAKELVDTESDKIFSTDDVGNLNEEILTLHSKGKTIVEISKLLEIGQGEVKLVIDLYCGRK